MTALIDALCPNAPGGRVVLMGFPDWECIYCHRPVRDHEVIGEES